MASIDDEVLERLRTKDQLLFGLSDILDAKAGIGLVVITFLASQSTDLLTADKTIGLWRWAQFASIFCLVLAGIAAIGSLWPRDHDSEPAEGLDDWVKELTEYYKNDPKPGEAVERAFRDGMVQRLKERIATNSAIDAAKSDLITLSYRFAGVALGLNLVTLLGISV